MPGDKLSNCTASQFTATFRVIWDQAFLSGYTTGIEASSHSMGQGELMYGFDYRTHYECMSVAFIGFFLEVARFRSFIFFMRRSVQNKLLLKNKSNVKNTKDISTHMPSEITEEQLFVCPRTLTSANDAKTIYSTSGIRWGSAANFTSHFVCFSQVTCGSQIVQFLLNITCTYIYFIAHRGQMKVYKQY